MFSDGGSKHFKNRFTQYFFSTQCNENINIEYNFFISYHGHSFCDSHIAHLHQSVHNYLMHSMHKRSRASSSSEPVSALLSPLLNLQKLKDVLDNSFKPKKKTSNAPVQIAVTVVLLNNIDRSDHLKPNVNAFPKKM